MALRARACVLLASLLSSAVVSPAAGSMHNDNSDADNLQCFLPGRCESTETRPVKFVEVLLKVTITANVFFNYRDDRRKEIISSTVAQQFAISPGYIDPFDYRREGNVVIVTVIIKIPKDISLRSPEWYRKKCEKDGASWLLKSSPFEAQSRFPADFWTAGEPVTQAAPQETVSETRSAVEKAKEQNRLSDEFPSNS